MKKNPYQFTIRFNSTIAGHCQAAAFLNRCGTRAKAHVIAEALDLDLPEDIDYDTLGGMIFSCLRIIPADGSQFDVQVNGLNIHVEKMEDQRVESALVSKILPEKEEEE